MLELKSHLYNACICALDFMRRPAETSEGKERQAVRYLSHECIEQVTRAHMTVLRAPDSGVTVVLQCCRSGVKVVL
jgi:hypothetical protein